MAADEVMQRIFYLTQIEPERLLMSTRTRRHRRPFRKTRRCRALRVGRDRHGRGADRAQVGAELNDFFNDMGAAANATGPTAYQANPRAIIRVRTSGHGFRRRA